MATRKLSAKPNQIDSTEVCTLALKQVKCAADYYQIGSVNSTEVLTAAWEELTTDEQQCIADLINNNAQPDPQTLADELMACGTALELKRIKAEHGDVAVKAAWKLLPQSERDRIKAICEGEPLLQPELQPEPATRKPDPN